MGDLKWWTQKVENDWVCYEIYIFAAAENKFCIKI